jgi:hypothetical protein
VNRRPWRIGVPSVTEDEVNSLVTRVRIDIAEILDDVLDTEAGLTRIYAAHGRQSPSSAAAPSQLRNTGRQGRSSTH